MTGGGRYPPAAPYAPLLVGRPSRRALLAGGAALLLAGCGSPRAGDSGASGREPAAAVPLPVSRDPRFRVAGTTKVFYGSDSDRQFGDLWVPDGVPAGSSLSVLMILHGGGWLAKSRLSYMESFAQAMAARGVAAWNVEYRGVDGGGGWPQTFEDVAAAMDRVPTLGEQAGAAIDPQRFFLTGHSAGGNLAVWAASRKAHPESQPGGGPRIEARGCFPMAGVYDLALAQEHGDGYLVPLLGGKPGEVPERYDLASPVKNLPTGARLVCFHGRNDGTVNVEQALEYVRLARDAGDAADGVILDDAPHGSWTSDGSTQWTTAHDRIVQEIAAT